MKKSRILLISVLGMFLFIPLSNYSTAAPPDYIGVQVGEEYIWTLGVNVDGYAAMITDMGETVPPDISMFETMPSIQMKGVIEYISDEISGVVYDYVIINISIYMNVPGYGWQSPMPPGEYLPVFVLSNATSNYFNDTMNALETESTPYGFAFPFMIVPHNLNWTEAANGLNDLVDMLTGGSTGETIEQNGNGFKVTIPSQMINGSLMQEMEVTAQWNSKGVFGQGAMKYGGTNVITINAPSSEEIPGFDVLILIGIVGLSTAGIIYYVKRKK
ncbi:MAG: hypothetical protein ACFE8B_01585 [Candidatus Hermodarchaeota archaeon]